MTEAERAWCAGFFDGEGCIYIRLRDNGGASLCLELGQRRPEAVLRLVNLLGGTMQRKTRKSASTGNRVFHVYRWCVSGPMAVSALQAMMPYLTEKRAQAQVAIDSGLQWGQARGKHVGPAVRATREWAYTRLREMKREWI